MEVRVMDHYSAQHEPQTFTGSALQIETQLRDHFKGTLGHIPFGNLHEMVETLRRMSGIDIWVSEEAPRVQKRHHKGPQAVSDPWLHEIDLPMSDDDSNL